MAAEVACRRCGDYATRWPLDGISLCATCLDAPRGDRPLVSDLGNRLARAALLVLAMPFALSGCGLAWVARDVFREKGHDVDALAVLGLALACFAICFGIALLGGAVHRRWMRTFLRAHALPWLDPQDVLLAPVTRDGERKEEGMVFVVPGGFAFLGREGTRRATPFSTIRSWSVLEKEGERGIVLVEADGRRTRIHRLVAKDVASDALAKHFLRRVGPPGRP